MKKLGLFLTLSLLAGCAAPAAVSDVSDSMVKVRGNQYTPVTEIDAQAKQACALYKKDAVKMSKFCVDSQCVYQDTLFVCKELVGSE